jgi:uncharacterized protein (DUF58 family)
VQRVLDAMADGLRSFLLFCYRNHNLLFVLAALGTMAVLAVISGYWFFYRATYVLAGLVALCFIWARVQAGALEVQVERANDRLQVGQEAEARVRLKSDSNFTKIWLEAEDKTDMPGRHARTVVTLPSRGTRNWKVSLNCSRRGVFSAGPVRITTGDPFGLFRLSQDYGERQQILVLPRPEELPYFWSPVAQLPGEGIVRRRTHYVTPNASGVREYYPGDSYNRIHWRSTARLGRLMVKTFEMDPTSNVWVLLDLNESVQAGEGDESTEEYGVRIATSLAYHFVQSNRVLGLIAYGHETVVLDPTRGSQQYGRILEAMAVARATGTTSLDRVLEEENRRFGRHTTLLVVTPSAGDEWLPAMESAVQHGTRAAVVLLDAASFGANEAPALPLESLAAIGVPAYTVRAGSDISLMLGPAGLAGESTYERPKALVH